jgi:hypothetical protein
VTAGGEMLSELADSDVSSSVLGFKLTDQAAPPSDVGGNQSIWALQELQR